MKNCKKGLTLIEMLVVISIISIMATSSVVALTKFRSTISISSIIEVINTNIHTQEIQVLTKELQSTEFHFSLNHSKLYYFIAKQNISEQQKTTLAGDITINTITEASDTSSGSTSFSWKNPTNKDILIEAHAGEKSVLKERMNQPLAETGIKTLNDLNASQKYKIFISDPVKNLFESFITILYYSPANISYKNHVLLTKLEGLNFSGQWQPISNAQLKIQAPFAKKKYSSSNINFKKLRLTFSQNDKEIQYEI